MTDLRPPSDDRLVPLVPDVRTLEERAARAWTEPMAVRPLEDGRYAVDSASGATYVVDPAERSCTCPDHRIRGERCKHLRRVAIEITARRVPPPGWRRGTCRACGTDTFVERDADPPLCSACRVEAGDVVTDRETGDRLVVDAVRDQRADEAWIEAADCTVAEYGTNDGYPADDPVIEAVYLSDYGRSEPRRYAFPLSRLERIEDAALVE